MTNTQVEGASSKHGVCWNIMFDGDEDHKTWINISSPSQQTVNLLNGTPLNPGSELRGREIRRTPPHWTPVKAACKSSQRCVSKRCSRLPCKVPTFTPFGRSLKNNFTPRANQNNFTPLANQTTENGLAKHLKLKPSEQRTLIFSEDEQVPDKMHTASSLR